jgi:hypothetical protein
MEILLVIVVLAVIAAAAFMWYRSRNQGSAALSDRGGPALRGRRGAARASRRDPMAEAVERHAMATDPHEAAEAELRLQAQANRVAADLHAQQASTLEGAAGRGGAGDAYAQPPAYDATQQPVYQNDAVAYGDDRGVYETRDGRTIDAMGNRVVVDEGPIPPRGQPVDDLGRPVAADDGAAYYDEQGRPVYPEDRPRY